MSQTVTIKLKLPGDLGKLRLPRRLDARLQELLDQQDSGKRLTPAERSEAEELTDLADFFTLLKLRAKGRAGPGDRSRR